MSEVHMSDKVWEFHAHQPAKIGVLVIERRRTKNGVRVDEKKQ